MKPYDHRDIEQKWQQQWADERLYAVSDKVEGKDNFYELVEFTYPSGNLHVGHWYAFAVPDIHARYKRMSGYNVLYPMGFDAFGLPAENAAIKLGADPKVWTYEQMEKMRTQLRSMGAMFDWDREVVSCAPEYYKWTQWMFNQFLKNDLVYRDITMVNWCPKDQTILANEQVNDGRCDRCGTEVVQREQPQWMLRITKYADRLIDDLDALDWPEEIKAAQRNWIGRSEGSEISFKLSTGDSVPVFTTRADTLFGVTYIVLAPEHQLVQKLLDQVENKADVEAYIDTTKKKLELERQQSKEKTGVHLRGITATNPANGEAVPVWIADYVLAGYGTGAVMAVPAHDERDFEFAKKYGLPSKEVVLESIVPEGTYEIAKSNRGGLAVITRKDDNKILLQFENKWKQWRLVGGSLEDNETPEQGVVREVLEETGYTATVIKPLGSTHVCYQRFTDNNRIYERRAYGFVVEIDESTKKEVQLTKEESEAGLVYEWIEPRKAIELMRSNISPMGEVELIERHLSGREIFTDSGILVDSNEFNGLTSEEARKKITEFVGGKIVKTYRLRDWGISRQRYWGCPIPIVYDPEGKAHPVPDEYLPWLLPTDVDHTPDGTAPLARSKELLERTEKIFGTGWKPEVETMDAFVDSTWYFYRYLDNKNDNEFASKEAMSTWMPLDLYMGGAEHTTMHLLYSRFWNKGLHDMGLVKDSEPYVIRRNRGIILGTDGNKMSKSKGNVIAPDEVVARLGADTVRMYLAFIGPYGVVNHAPWDPNGVVGVRRFLERVWKLADKIDAEKKVCRTDALLHKTIKGVGEDIEEFKFNTAIAKMMILVNAFEKEEALVKNSYVVLLRLLAPFAPHMTEELWHELGEEESIHLAPWPTYDESLLVDDVVTVGVQINGKLRAEIEYPSDTTKESIEAAVLALPKVKAYTDGKTIKQVIIVPGRVINIVLA